MPATRRRKRPLSAGEYSLHERGVPLPLLPAQRQRVLPARQTCGAIFIVNTIGGDAPVGEIAGVHVLAADTDGIDGVEDNAGALVTPDTLARASALGLKAQDFLDRNDAYNFFEPLGDLVVTGPTFTNVNDFRALLIL